MAYGALMELGDVSHTLNRVNFFAIRKRDSKARSVSNTAWTLMISLYAIREEVFTEWMLDPQKKNKIGIIFSEGMDTVKRWDFEDVFCVGFEESFIEDLGVFETVIILTGESVNNGNATIKYDWGA
ncbi:type VI secretion system tube protein TssD [Larkinella sp. VNQ87]|uniref:type VI secretion system tube protein TssD n=1 Tax=Larkinella sp. VNQ87 TaxID=3400921 RepID=UPI003C0D8717